MGECLNLRAEIARNKLKLKVIAVQLGISEKTLRNKITGASDFTLGEVDRLHQTYFASVDKNTLFARNREAS